MKTLRLYSGLTPGRKNFSFFCAGFLFAVFIMLILSGCGSKESNQSIITKEVVRSAAILSDLAFDDAEIDSMLDGLNAYRSSYQSMRNVSLSNDVPPAFIFSPVPPGYRADIYTGIPDYGLPAKVSIPENREELCFYPVSELSVLLRTGQITSEELTRLYINRLKEYDPVLHCVVTLLEDRALAQAKKADREIRAGKYRGPLHGIPYGVKDLLDVEGVPSTWGSRLYEKQIAGHTAAIVQRLDSAGAVLVAKLSLGEFAMGDVWFKDMTRNPWNPATGSSGSSAGSASATAAGLVGFAIGSETWGSIVSPSTVCGVTGLRPTFGRVPRTGAMTLSWTMDKLGPIARTALDCAIILAAINGSHPGDPASVSVPFSFKASQNLKNLRVAYDEEIFTRNYPFRANDSSVIELLRHLGFQMVPVRVPDTIPVNSLSIILEAEAAAAFDELTRSGKDTMMVRQTKDAWPNIFRQARTIPAVEYVQASRLRTLLINEFNRLFQKADVIVFPSLEGNQLLITNLTGHPALSVPSGFDAQGMPTSVTFVGNWYCEQNILLLARAYQEYTQWYKRTPPDFTPSK